MLKFSAAMPRAIPIIFFVTSTLLSEISWAATLNVDTNNPSCNNVSGNPYCKVKSAVDSAQAGDTISIAAGTYSENGITIGRNISMKGAGARTAIIDGGGQGPRIFTLSTGVTVTMENLTLQNGKEETGSGGGAIYNQGTLTLKESTLKSNVSTTDGGGIFNTGTFTIDRCTISHNSAVNGGGIRHASGQFGGHLTIESATFTENRSLEYGGALQLDGHANISNSTVYANYADDDLNDSGHAGGVSVGDFTWGPTLSPVPTDILYVYLKNTIIAGNRDRSPSQHTPPHECRGALISMGYNLFEIPTGCWPSNGFQPTDISGPYPPTYTIAVNLGPLANNGGPTDTVLTQAGSLAIDTGDPSSCPSTDQRGFVRPSDSNNDGTSTCEIGAVEWKTCGDGALDTGEGCDDGNRDNPGACLSTCVSATCGDGFVQKEVEKCDEGAGNSDKSNATCRTNCLPARCGDGIVDAPDECDQGINNSNSPNADCRTNCLLAECGDGIVDTLDEECDLGTANSDAPDAVCRSDCSSARCGDGIIDPSAEECDAGDDNSAEPGAPCRADCSAAGCGDGILDTDEKCDDGELNGTLGDSCDSTCVRISPLDDSIGNNLFNATVPSGGCDAAIPAKNRPLTTDQ